MTVWAQGQSRNYGVSNATGRVWALNWCSHSWSHEWQTQSLRCFTHCQNVVDRKLRRAEVEEKEQMLLAWDPACLLPCCFTCSLWDDQIFVVSAWLRAWYISAIVCTCLHLQPPVKLRQRIFGKICTWQRCSSRTQHACLLDDALLILPTFRIFRAF